MKDKSLVSTSKFLSLVLRHQPEVVGMQLDEEGWLEINALIDAANQHGKQLSLELLHEVVATNDKKRFALSDDGLRIRASQGHSVASVDLKLAETTPPATLYHGTVAAFIESIRSTGLEKRSRNHVHLSTDEATAIKVGSRRGKPIILQVDAAAMHQDGHRFFLSANGVWLVDAVPVEFLTFPMSGAECNIGTLL
ncbi:RNA 2'-phosphotransferase [Rubripirellula obstinata]|uniref:Probable RNA 2'-phosphotransferase n=1 Tax=Rubripirellula obstinata TaxID=406547 RepID=A0A5B1CEJ8_9BACT|nr:RNA 2'-phosphotransferase [Rubripirellula obstinata]KAA1258179.1 RNA 2'-phosphotransferase [Rubripirellula obstinata]